MSGSQWVTEGNLVLAYHHDHQAPPFVFCMWPAYLIALYLASGSHCPFPKVLTSSPNTTMSFSPRLDLTPVPVRSPQIDLLLVLLMLGNMIHLRIPLLYLCYFLGLDTLLIGSSPEIASLPSYLGFTKRLQAVIFCLSYFILIFPVRSFLCVHYPGP